MTVGGVVVCVHGRSPVVYYVVLLESSRESRIF